MNRLERVLNAVRVWRALRRDAHMGAFDGPVIDALTELAAAIDDLDAFTKKPTEPSMSAVSAADEPPKTDRNS